MIINKKRWVISFLAVNILVLIIVFGGFIEGGVVFAGEEEVEPILIGVPTPITGPGAGMGEDVVAGIELAVKKVNEDGGVLGRPLEVLISDIGIGSAEVINSAADLMDRQGVSVFFAGPFFGAAGVHGFGRYEQPMFHGSAMVELVDAVVENFDEYRNVFQITASEEAYSPNAFNIMTNKLPYELPNKKVALLGGDITYDMEIQESFKEIALENGWDIILDDTYPYGTTEFSAQLSRIRSDNPSIIYGVITSVDSAVAFINQFLQDPTDSLVFIQWSPASSEFIGLLGDRANGILWSTLIGHLPTPENEAWADEFEELYGRSPGATWPAVVDDTLNIWINAVEAVGDERDYEAIYEYLENLSEHPYDGRSGRYGMDPERHEALTGSEWLPLHFTQIQDQSDRVLYFGDELNPESEFIVPPWISE